MDAIRSLRFAVVILLCQWGFPAQAVTPPQYREEPRFDLKAAFGTTGDWKAEVTAALEPEREIVSDEGLSQSRICFVRMEPPVSECAYFSELFDSKLKFQVFSSFSVVQLKSGSAAANGLVMKAAAWYSTGQVPETAIWVYDAQQDRFRLISALKSGEVRIFGSGILNGILVTADWHRDEGETRWSDHRRDIAVYRYSADGEDASYQKMLKYTTAKRYGAEDTSSIDAELANIQAKIP